MSNRQQRRRQRVIKTEGGRSAMLLTAGPVLPVPARQTYVDDPLKGVAEGEHLWAMFAVFRIRNPESVMDPAVPKYMDLENLLTVEGPGCYKCEQYYKPAVAALPCPGEPD